MFTKQSFEFLQKVKNFENININSAIWNDDNKTLQLLEQEKKDIKWKIKILQEISYKCEGKCPYCMNRGLNYQVEELPIKNYINFYKHLIQDGHTICELRLTGGEPLLYPHLIELIKYTRIECKINEIG